MTSVKLSKQYTSGDVVFDSVTLREPTYKDVYMDGLGVPRDWQPVVGGGAAMLVYPDKIDAYLQRIITNPGYEHIGSLSAADSVRLGGAVCDFFQASPASSKPPMPSSGTSDGGPTT